MRSAEEGGADAEGRHQFFNKPLVIKTAQNTPAEVNNAASSVLRHPACLSITLFAKTQLTNAQYYIQQWWVIIGSCHEDIDTQFLCCCWWWLCMMMMMMMMIYIYIMMKCMFVSHEKWSIPPGSFLWPPELPITTLYNSGLVLMVLDWFFMVPFRFSVV